MPQFIKFDVKKDGHHHIIVHSTDNPMIEHGAKLYGSKAMICTWVRGVWSGVGETAMGAKNLHLKETKCMCKGAHYCEWTSKW